MKVFLVSKGSYDDYEIRGVFEYEDIANQAVERGFGDAVEVFEILEYVPDRVTVWSVTADLGRGMCPVPAGVQTWPIDLPGDLDRLHSGPDSDSWSIRSLDRDKAVAAVTEALTARRAELGVPNA